MKRKFMRIEEEILLKKGSLKIKGL